MHSGPSRLHGTFFFLWSSQPFRLAHLHESIFFFFLKNNSQILKFVIKNRKKALPRLFACPCPNKNPLNSIKFVEINNSPIRQFVIKSQLIPDRRDRSRAPSSSLSRYHVSVATSPSKTRRKTCKRAENLLPLHRENE